MGIVCEIAGVDVSVYLRALDVEAPERGAVGTGTLYLSKEAGGLTILPAAHVKVWREDGAGDITRRYIGGFASGRMTTSIADEKIWELPVQDYNILLDTLWTDKQWATRITVAAGTFKAQVQDLVTQLTTGAAEGIDTDEGVADLWPTMPDRTFPTGMSLRGMLQELCDYVQEQDPDIEPGFHINYTTTTDAIFGAPVLQMYDRAATPTPTAEFSNIQADWDAGYDKYLGEPGDFKRTQDRTTQITRRQAYKFQDGVVGNVATAADATAIATYPNPFSSTESWMAEPIEYNDAYDVTELQAFINRSVAATANPRDTIEWQTNVMLAPGDYVTHSHDLEALDDYLQQVTSVTYDFTDPITDYLFVTSGPPILEFGENGEDDIVRPPPEGDNTAPGPPTLGAPTRNFYHSRLDRAIVRIPVTPPPDNDFSHLRVIVTQGSLVDDLGDLYLDTAGNLNLTLRPGYQTSVTAFSVDSSGNQSETADTEGPFTTAQAIKYVLDPVPVADDEDPTQAEGYETDTTGAASVALVTAANIFGPTTFELNCGSTIGNYAELLSPPVYTARLDDATAVLLHGKAGLLYYYTDVATGTLNATIEGYDITDTIISSVTIYNDTPVAGAVQIEDNQYANTTLYYVRLRVRYTSTGTANDLYCNLEVPADIISTGLIKNTAVTTAKLANLAVTSGKLAANAVTAGKIATGGVSATAQIADGIVATDKMADSAVIPGKASLGNNILENGSMEVPNSGGTLPAGWTTSGTVTYEDTSGAGSSGDGVRHLKMGTVTGTHFIIGPLYTWARGRTSQVFRFKYYRSSTTTNTPAAKLRCYDKSKAFISAVNMLDDTGGALAWGTTGAWTEETATVNGTSIPAGTVYVAPYFEVVLSAGTAYLSIDAVNTSDAITPYRSQHFEIANGDGTYRGEYGLNLSSGNLEIVPTSTNILNVPAFLAAEHLQSNSGTPGITAGDGAGVTGTPTISLSGSDIAGLVTLTTSSSPAASDTIFTVTFAIAYASAPHIIITPADSDAAVLSGASMPYLDQAVTSTTQFVFKSGGTGLIGSTQYRWHYMVCQ